MENPEEILHSLEEFAKLRPKSIPRELEEYLCFVAKTGDPVYQWSVIKCLFREKLINVITEFYESCPSVSIPSCRNVDIFNYDTMKTFILEKLDTFVAAPFTVQRICELLTTPRKEYNRIDKYMRALEKNILVVSTTEPGNQRTPENGDGLINGIESDHVQDGSHDINIEEMDDAPVWPPKSEESYQSTSKEEPSMGEKVYTEAEPATSGQQSLETVICSPSEEQSFVSIAVNNESEVNAVINEEHEEAGKVDDSDAEIQVANEEGDGVSDAVPAIVQRRRTSIEPPSDQCEDTQQMPIEKDSDSTTPCQDTEIPMDNTETSSDLPMQHLPTEADTLKEDILIEESKASTSETSDPLDIPEHSGGGDCPTERTTIEPSLVDETTSTPPIPADAATQDNLDLTEQAEIDVTSFPNKIETPTEMPASTETPTLSTEAPQEEVIPTPQPEIHENEEKLLTEEPQTEPCIPEVEPTEEVQEPTSPLRESDIRTEETALSSEIESTTTHVNESETPESSVQPPVETVDAPEEDITSITEEQKALETQETPEFIEATEAPELENPVESTPVVDPPTAILAEEPATSMEVDVMDTDAGDSPIEDAPQTDSMDSTDSNN